MMPTRNPDSPSLPSPKKEQLELKSKRWAMLALAALIPTVPCFAFIAPIWQFVVSLGTVAFMFAALGLGLLLAAGPVAVVVCCLTALFLRVESCFTEAKVSRSKLDWLIISIGMLVSFAPAMGILVVPIRAILTGYIAFRGPGQQYAIGEDPYGFWQAVSFWLMGAASLAFLSAVYWRSRFLRRAHQKEA